uniref:Uncharacterized protein n=1 Tax=Arundo donax TaxID=35708 RepID=A0A0A8YD83_ARUDO
MAAKSTTARPYFSPSLSPRAPQFNLQ